ncbi:Eaa protein [Salmonella enterica]
MSTITRERLLKIQQWRETYGAGSNVMLPAEEAAELARIALVSLEAKPVGEVSEKRHGLVMDGTVDLGGKSTYRIIKGEKEMKRLPLGTKFYIVPPVPVDNEFIPKNLDRALGVVGVELPESKEEFNFQTERWIQRLIDRVIRYADEFKEQPEPVVPESISVRQAIYALESADCVTTIGQAYKMGWNACRAAMLNGGKS